jgi:hypothetical protein
MRIRGLCGLAAVLSVIGGGSNTGATLPAPALVRAFAADAGLGDDLRIPRAAQPEQAVQAAAMVVPAAPAPAPAPATPPRPPVQAAAPAPRPHGPTAAELAWGQSHSNWLASPAADLSVGLLDYRDCGGSTPLPHTSAARDWCPASDVVYLVGHNPGTFTPLLHLHPGDLIRYWDPSGAATTYRLDHVDRVAAARGSDYMADSSRPHLTMQTCVDASATQYWMFVAYPV